MAKHPIKSSHHTLCALVMARGGSVLEPASAMREKRMERSLLERGKTSRYVVLQF
ncbi:MULTISPECIES: hypothetical protein [Photorhabdus]|uniref:hypothetical protein n=1 Tax=Photorhabdus TaxID=29487 RepID=UPI0012D4AC4D|nr:hypothetical protein [Photorhabdus luminescens]